MAEEGDPGQHTCWVVHLGGLHASGATEAMRVCVVTGTEQEAQDWLGRHRAAGLRSNLVEDRPLVSSVGALGPGEQREVHVVLAVDGEVATVHDARSTADRHVESLRRRGVDGVEVVDLVTNVWTDAGGR